MVYNKPGAATVCGLFSLSLDGSHPLTARLDCMPCAVPSYICRQNCLLVDELRDTHFPIGTID